jgi:hypothetical protein
MDAPPSWTEWLVDGFTRGHSVAETIAWASWTADFENWQSRQQSMPVGVTLLRRLRAAVVDHRPPLDRSRVRRGVYGGRLPTTEDTNRQGVLRPMRAPPGFQSSGDPCRAGETRPSHGG